MKKLIGLLSTILFLFLISSCKKEIPTKLSGYFYTTTASNPEDHLILFIDGEKIGKLPYINASKEVPLMPDDSTLLAVGLKHSLMSGKHSFRAERTDGKVISQSETSFLFYCNQTKSSTQGNIGGSGTSLVKDSFAMNLFE